MLINYTVNETLYVIGRGINAIELKERLKQDRVENIKLILTEEFFELPDHSQCIVGIWDVTYRKEFIEASKNKPMRWVSYVHDKAFVSDLTSIGPGVVVYPFAYIGYGVKIGNFGMIGQHTNIGHGTQLGQNNVVCPGSIFGGSVVTGANVMFNISSLIKDKTTVVGDVTFLMGSIIKKDIETPGTYYGDRRAAR